MRNWVAPDAEQETLRRRYLAHLGTDPDAWSRHSHAAHLTASAVITDATADRVLLALHAKVGRWLQTGGHLEPDDLGLADAAHREAVEESGLTSLVVDPVPLLLSEHPAPCRPDCRHLDVQFHAVAEVVAPTVSAESTDVAWFAVDDLPDTDDTVRALITAARARARA